MSTKNPLDFSNLFQQFDPTAMTKRLQEMFGNVDVPNVDVKALMETQSKNLQALTEANRAAIEGTQSLMQRQAEMVQQAMTEASEAAKALASSSGPKEALAQQTKLIESAFAKAMANAAEISDMIKKTQDQTTQLVSSRITESLADLRSSMEKVK
jgi:phasin family protein